MRTQIAAITERMTFVFLEILAEIALLSVYIVWQDDAKKSHRLKIKEETGTEEKEIARVNDDVSDKKEKFIVVTVVGLNDNTFSNTPFGYARKRHNQLTFSPDYKSFLFILFNTFVIFSK